MKENKRGGKRFIMAVSVFLAVLLWLYVINVENPNATMSLSNVPVTLQGVAELESNDLIVTELDRDSMRLRVSGKRKAFIKLNQSQVSVNLDVSKIKEPGEHVIIGSYVISDSSLSNSFTISESSRFAVTVTVKNRSSKEIPVVGEFGGSMAAGFEVESLVTSPEVIEVSGPEDVIDRISHAAVVIQGDQVEAEVIQEGLPILLIDTDGNILEDVNVKKSAQTSTATMTVVKVFTVPLTVQLTPGGGALESDAAVTISPPSIIVSGSAESLENLTEINLGRINLADIFSNETVSFPILLPSGVVNRSDDTSATVFVSIKNLPMRALTVSRIELISVPAGYTATSVNSSIQVWLRGPQSELDAISSNQLRVVVNLENIDAVSGQQRAPASVYLEGDTNVGVVGSDYSVAVVLER